MSDSSSSGNFPEDTWDSSDPVSMEEIAEAAREDPSSALSEVSRIRNRLLAEQSSIRLNAARTLRSIAKENPAEISDAIDDLRRLISREFDSSSGPLATFTSSDSDEIRRYATDAIAYIAEKDPHSVSAAVPELHRLLHDTNKTVRARALASLYRVAQEDPIAVRPTVPTLVHRLSEEDNDGDLGLLTLVGGTLVRITQAEPEAVRPALPDLKTLHAEESADVRSVVIEVLCELAKAYPDEVRQIAVDLLAFNNSTKQAAGEELRETLQETDLEQTAIEDEKPERVPYWSQFSVLDFPNPYSGEGLLLFVVGVLCWVLLFNLNVSSGSAMIGLFFVGFLLMTVGIAIISANGEEFLTTRDRAVALYNMADDDPEAVLTVEKINESITLLAHPSGYNRALAAETLGSLAEYDRERLAAGVKEASEHLIADSLGENIILKIKNTPNAEEIAAVKEILSKANTNRQSTEEWITSEFQTAERRIGEANDCFEDGDYGTAAEAYKDVIDILTRLQGEINVVSFDPLPDGKTVDDLESMLNRSKERWPDSELRTIERRVAEGDNCFENGEYGEAVEAYEDVITIVTRLRDEVEAVRFDPLDSKTVEDLESTLDRAKERWIDSCLAHGKRRLREAEKLIESDPRRAVESFESILEDFEALELPQSKTGPLRKQADEGIVRSKAAREIQQFEAAVDMSKNDEYDTAVDEFGVLEESFTALAEEAEDADLDSLHERLERYSDACERNVSTVRQARHGLESEPDLVSAGQIESNEMGVDSADVDEGEVTDEHSEPSGSAEPSPSTTAEESPQTVIGSRSGTKISPDSGSIPNEIPEAPTLELNYESFERGNQIGSGGNADVYRATVEADATEIAVKEPRMSETLHTEDIERMLNEAETWEQLDNHDHIVSIIDYGAKPLPWIAMEYMDAGHIGNSAAQMSFDQQLWTAIATSKAVRHAHRRGVAHLDLKPQNILLQSVEGHWDVPKVADWGLSKHLLEHSKSVDGMSPHYAAPEQFDDAFGTIDDITDIYQLGAVFYKLFTGQPPFEGEPFRVMNKIQSEQPRAPSEIANVPAELDEILFTALAKEKENRYDTVVYLRDELQKLR